MASPASPPDRPQQEDATVSHDQLAGAINNGTELAETSTTPDDYLKFAQGVSLLSAALVSLHNAEHPSPPPPQQPPPPGGSPTPPAVEQG